MIKGKLIKPGYTQVTEDSPVIHIRRQKFNEFTYNDADFRFSMYRRQYPLRLNNSTTIHKIIGETVDRLATRVAAKDVDKNYNIWDSSWISDLEVS